jgi:MFS-type transporter involved in bile tolerance (Atg22 family)
VTEKPNEKVETLSSGNSEDDMIAGKAAEEMTLHKKGDKHELILQRYQDALENDYKRNATLFVSSQLIWGLGYPFVVWATVGITYMTALGAPKTIIGLIQASWLIFGVLQLVLTKWFGSRPRKTWVAWSYFASAIPWSGYALVSLVWPELFSNNGHIFCFTFAMLFYVGVTTINGALHGSLTIDFTPVKRRGTLFGYGVAASAITLLTMAMVVRWVMSNWPEPQNYRISFLVGNAFCSVSYLLYLLYHEYANPLLVLEAKQKTVSSFWHDLFSELHSILKDKDYKIFIVFVMAATAAFTVGSFIMVFGKEKFNLTGSQVTIFTVLQAASAAVFSYIFGKIADKFGYRVVAILQGILAATCFTTMAVLSMKQILGASMLYLAFIINTGVLGSSALVLINMGIEIMHKHHSGNIIAINNLLMMPVGFVAPLIGMILDTTKSYLAVFSIGVILALVSAVGFVLFVPEPRKRIPNDGGQ